MFTVLDIKLDFTQFPHFDTQDQEYEKPQELWINANMMPSTC